MTAAVAAGPGVTDVITWMEGQREFRHVGAIARETGRSHPTVRKAIALLAAAGRIETGTPVLEGDDARRAGVTGYRVTAPDMAPDGRLDALLCAFQGCINGPEPDTERTAWFTVDGAAYYAVTPAQRTALMIVASLQATRRIWNLNAVTEDPSLPHQVVSLVMRGGLAISCNCLGARAHASRGRPRQFIEIRSLGTEFPVPDVLALWRAWHEQQGVSV